jgi:hypothetical protein
MSITLAGLMDWPGRSASARIDSFHTWTFDGTPHPRGEGTETLSSEEMAVVTRSGADYMTPPPQELVLIR